MAIVRMAPVLRPYIGGLKQVEIQGTTLEEVLHCLATAYPALYERIAPGGSLSRFLNIYVNEKDIRRLDGLQTLLQPSDIVILLPAMAGGKEESMKEKRA